MLEIQKKLHVFGRGGALTYGLSAVDIALWDIAGKLADAPLSQLLGGGVTTMPCYASLACYAEPALVRAVVRHAIDAGFAVLKLHEAGMPAIRAAREEAGPDVELIVDAGCPWTLTEAIADADELNAVGLKFLEEPLWPPENFEGLAELRHSTGIPIASGENASTLLEFERMLAAERWTSFSRARPRWGRQRVTQGLSSRGRPQHPGDDALLLRRSRVPRCAACDRRAGRRRLDDRVALVRTGSVHLRRRPHPEGGPDFGPAGSRPGHRPRSRRHQRLPSAHNTMRALWPTGAAASRVYTNSACINAESAEKGIEKP